MFMLKARSRVADVPGVVWALNRSLFIVAIILALLVSAGVAYAQGTPTVPAIESVAVTSDPGEDGGYSIDDEIQVGLTFSEAVTVTGVPQISLDVGGRNRTSEYSEGSTTTQLLFTYTVASGDEDTDGIAVVADSLALNGGAIRVGATNATLTHAALQANDHKVDGIAPTVTVGGETRTYVPQDRQFNVVFYFSEKVYGITDDEITVTNGAAHDVRATSGNDTWPRYTRWDVIIVSVAEGPVTVTLEAGAATDAYGNENTAPGSALSVIAADPVMVEVTRTTSGFAEGGKAEFIVARSRDNGAIPVSLSLDQTGDFLSGAVEVYPPPDPNMPENPVTPTEVEFTETPYNLNVTFAAGETRKRIAVLTEDDYRVENDGTVTLSVPARPDQYKYIPGYASSASADVRDNDETASVSLYWSRPFNPYTPIPLDTALEGSSIVLGVYGRAIGQPLLVTLGVTEVGSYLDLDDERAMGYENLGNGKLRVTLPAGSYFKNVAIPLLENDVREADGSVTITVEPDPGRSYTPSVGQGTLTIPVKDNDSPSTVSISAPDSITEGAQLTYTLTRTSDGGQSRAELTVNLQLEQTGDYISWPTAHQPDADGLVTIPVTIAGSLTGTLALDTVDDEVSEDNGSVIATILADTNGNYVAGTSSAVTATLLDNDPPIISVEAVAAVVTEGTNAQYRITRSGNTSGSLRVGLYVTGLSKIMTDATETIVLTSDNEDQSKRLTINGAWVDSILEFAAGETEKTVSFTTEADNINEGDGWLGVRIVQRVANPFSIGTGYAQVLVKDDDIPTVSLIQPVGPTGLTLSSDGTTWEGKIVEGTQFTYNSTCTGVTEFSDDASVNLDPVSMWVQYSNHPAFYGEQYQNGTLGYNKAGIHHLGADCSSQTVTYRDYRFYVGPENGVLEIEIVPRSELVKQGGESSRYRPRLFAELALQYEAAAAEAQAAGTLITQKNIFHPISLVGYHPEFACNESDLRYCPQYQVGTVNKIRLTVTNRDPTILIKAESTSVTEGQPAKFILERRWATDLLALAPPQSEMVVYLRATQDGQYITGALPTQITFGQNETRKVVELQTVDDSAFGDNGSVTIELLPDTSTGSVNLHGNYTIWENWVGHTPTGGRSDKATVTITNDDDKPGITIAPASATEGDSGSANMTFTLTLAQAVTGAVAVNYATSDGTATAGQDYTTVTSGTATIPANSTSATFTVSVTGDTTDEPNETFNVTISLPEPEPDLPDGSGSSPPDVAIVGGNTATVSGTIVDDDPVVVTVAPKADSVVEGQDAVFVLTRTGYTDDALSMQVRLSAPGKVETLSAEFEASATTTELSVETEDNDLVDYPSTHDYTIEALGDGDISDRDDEIYTPGTPSQATVSVTDNDELQIITVHPHVALVREGGEVKYVFRRTGDTSEELWFTYAREARQAETTSYEDYYFVNERFPAGVSEITTGALLNGVAFPSDQVVNRLYPYTFTAQVYGDGQRYGLHRIWKAGTPDTATIAYYDDDRTRDTVLLAKYPSLVQVGQTISFDFELLNTGSEATGNTITVSSVKRDLGDRGQPKPAEPRVSCIISGSLAAGEIGTCRATFTLTAQDLTDSPMVLDATASDGTTTSSTLRIYITVLGGVAVGFKETARLSVTEPANGAANAQAVLEVTRVGESGQQVQVAYTVEPIRTTLRPYPPEAGADYVDNSATPGILTFAANETKKNITIDILGDEIDEPTELLRVTLVPPEGVLVEAAKRNRAVAIVDADPPSGESYLPTASLELVSADPTPESAGSVDFAVVLDRVWGEDARFEVELDAHNNLTATPAFSRLGQTGDFEAPDGLIHATIPAGQTRFEFSLTLYDDDVREEDETFQMLLGSSITNSQRHIGDEDKVLVTIADDDLVEPTGIELALTRNNSVFDSMAENSSQRNITVTASFSDIRWPTDAADAALRPADPRDVDTTVRVTFDDPNSAAAQTDIERFQVADSQGTFQDVESFDIVIPAGQTSGTTTLRFKPENDDVDEEAETVILQGAEVVASDSDEFLPVNSASFTITDDDARGITVSLANLFIGMMEGETSTYNLVLDSEPTDTVTVTVATRQDNLIRLTPETLTFTPSDWSTAQTIFVESLDDGTDASFTEAFLAHRVSGGDYGSVSVGDIWMIIENTTQAYIYLDDAQASESDGYVEFTVSVRPILRTVPVVVRYTTVDGTAAAGTDYTRQVNTGQTYKIFNIPANGGAATIRIPIMDNEVYGPAKKTFTLQLTNQNNKALLDGDATSLTATGSIIDDDPKPVVSVAGPAGDLSYVSEDMKGPVTFTLTLTGRSAADVTVDYATGQAQVLSGLAARQGITPATAGEDYTAATGTITFSPGDATKQVTVQLTDDDVSEDTEFFGFEISNAQNAQLRNEATKEVADVGLLDDDPRGVAIDPTSISLEEPAPGEAAVASSYTVKLNSKPTDTVTVTIGGANPAVSLSGATLSNANTLTFTTSNWGTAQTVTVTPVEDANGIGETITLTHIQSGGDYTGIAADSVTINVTDSDTRNVVLSPTSLTLTEGDDTGVSYTVKLSTQPSDIVTVTVGGHSGTDLSISGTTLSSNQLTFTTSNWDTAQTVTVKADHDGNSDDESETLTHTASGGDYANLTKDLPVTVTDDAPATVTVSFGAASYTVAEGSSRTVTVSLDADPERRVVIPIEAANEGGASDSDYSGVPVNVTFDAGDTSQTFDISATEDNLAEAGEKVKLSFGTLPTDATAGTPGETTVSIYDRTQGQDLPTPPTVHFENAAYSVDEGASVAVKVKLSKAPGSEAVIPISRTNRAGASDDDYSGVPDSLTFAATDTEKTITFAATDDSVDDDDEKVNLSFGSLPGGITATSGEASEAVVTIADNDKPAALTVQFGQAAYTAAEGFTVTVTVTLSGDPEMDLAIPISKTNEGGAMSADYSGVPNSVTFNSGDTEKTFTFTAASDSVDDDGESVKLEFGALPTTPIAVTAGTTDEATVTITDDDVPSVTVSFGAASYTVTEGSSRTVTVSLDADPERTVVIPIEAANEGGASDSDYTGVPESVTFDAGDISKSFDLSAVEDNLAESGERVKLSFGTLPADASAGTPSEASVSIHDRTQGQDLPTSPTVHFESAAYSVDEGATVAVKVKLSKAPGSEAVIPISITNRAGASDNDYTGVPDSLTFGAADTEKTITFAATDDSVDDDGEKVELSFGSLPGGITATAGEAAEAVVTITDDDKPTALTVEFGQAAYTAAEGSTVTVKVTLSDDPEMDLTIPISKTNEGGASASDYSGVPPSVTFGSGDTEKTFVFTAETDAVDDDDESVKLSFGTLPTTPVTVTAGTTDEATVTITDDDVPSVTVSFGSAAYTVAESDDSDTTDVTENTVEVTLTLSADPERTVVIPIEKINQGGATTADYSGVPQNVTFDSGDTSESFTFTAETDTVDDDGESVKLSFGASLPAGVSAVTPATSTVTITDDDVPSVTVSFGSAAYTVAESDDSDTPDVTENTVEVTVTLDADPERTVVIPIEKTNQGGATTADYSGVPQNVSFDSGDTQKSFVFTAETDTDDDHGESVRLSFDTMPDARVSEGSPSEAMVTIRQDSTPSTADCNSAIWCADLEFRSESPPGEMWFLGSTFVDSQFHYGGVTYRFGHMDVAPYGHNIPINGQPNPPWAIPERTKFYFSLHNMNASGYDLDRFRVPNDDWMDWTLHISTTKNGETLTAVLPFSEARFGGGQSEWRWYGSDLEALRAAWTEGQVYKLKIVEDPRSQRTPKVLGPPLYLKVTPYTNHTLGAWWKMPENRVDRAPPNTTYKVQWKEASDSWDNPADVSEETDSPSPATNEILSHSIRGLTGGVEYHVRVIATNTVGDSEPSEVVSGTPTPLPATGQNIAANSPAKGAPSIEGTPEVGRTLSAVTTDITDDDGLQDVVFSYQWLADDVEISGADGATYILTSDDLGKAINVRVDFTDNAGNEESLTSAPTAAVTAADDLELQSATVDGSTLTLTYNETLDTGVTLPASAFVVNVNEASRSIMGAGVGGSSVLLLLSPAVVAGDTVNVDYTKPSGSDVIKDTQGRQVDSFTGQAVTNNTAPAETERSDPAQTPGSPNSLNVVRHESGKLMATWAAPDSGSDPTGYTLQWKEAGDGWETQDSVSQADVKGTSHLITGLTDGVEYAVRVIASADDSESDPSTEATGTPRETTPPSPSSVSVNGATLTVTFDEALAEVQAPASTAFAVTVAGNSRGVSAVVVSGSAVTLTLVTAVSEGDAVTVDYTAPTGESAARLQDLAGNAAASFSGLDAGNDTQAADQLTASAHDVPGSHDGSTVFTFELRFSENFHLSYKTLRDHAFTVTGGEVTGARRLAPPSNIGWEIQVEPDGDGAAAIVLPVTTDCTAEGAICTEEGRMLSGGLLLVVPGPNTPATGAPTISGTAQVRDTLTAVTTGIADADGLDSAAFSYQWLADDAEINGATASTYTLVAADAGKAIKVQVSFTDDAGNDEELNSAATAAVAAASPPPNTPATGLPTITGTAQVGDTLTAVTTGIADADGLDSAAFSYQWLADDAEINGATASTYTLVAADAGKAIKVQVSFTDDAGNDEELNSAATAAVAAASPPPNTPATGLPTITGTAQVGDTLTAVTTGIEDADGLDNVIFSYQWIRNDGGTDTDISGATGSSYTLGDSDVDKTVKVRVSFTDDANNRETVTSAATAAVAARPNSLATGAPTILGTAQVEETLTADTSGIADEDGLTNASFAYQWLADGADVSGATDSSYTLAVDDGSKVISVKVSFSDDAGNEEDSTSAATAAVEAKPNTPATGAPTISGTAQVGETLTAETSGIADEDGLDNAAFTYQWLANGADIAGATGSTYTLAVADEGKAVSMKVSFTDDAGNAETLTSAATATVEAKANSPATGAPTISGTAQVGETLTAETSGIADEDGLDNAAFTYQWLADGADIAGATGSTYTLAGSDEGKAISAKVSFKDDAGQAESLTSAATAAVEADPLPPLTASLENMATSHDGENAFHLRVAVQRGVQPEL